MLKISDKPLDAPLRGSKDFKMLEQIKLSKMSGKLLGIGAINTDTTTNDFCIRQHAIPKEKNNICPLCYSHAMLTTFRKSCIPAFQHNSKLMAELIDWDLLPIINQAFFRFNGHGELINFNHFQNIINIARKNPHCNFALWTKRVQIVRQFKGELPDNLILVFSNPRIDSVIGVPRAFHKVFNNVDKGSDIKQNCTGKRCMDCLLCYRKESGANVIIEAVK